MHEGDSDITTLTVDADATIKIKIARTSNADFSNVEEALFLSFRNAVDFLPYDFDN